MFETRNPWRAPWAILAALAFILPAASGSPTYTIRIIPAAGGGDITPYAINNGGTVVGAVGTASGALNAAYWRDNTSVNLNRPGILDSVAYAVNNTGTVAGVVMTSPGYYRPCVWNRGRITQLMQNTGAAMAISASGHVTGWALGPDFQQRAFLWRGGRLRWLMVKPSFATALNERGQVVGQMHSPDGGRAFLWEERRGRAALTGDALTDLGTLGGNVSQALSINNAGEVVGWSNTARGEVRAFLYRNGRMERLPDLGGAFSRANAITNDGGIVGAATRPNGNSRAVLWRGHQVLDLNDALPPDSGWVLYGATGMNASGQVIGYGAYNGRPGSFILNPR